MVQEPLSVPPTPTQPPAEFKADAKVEITTEFKPEAEALTRKKTGPARGRPGESKPGAAKTDAARSGATKTGDTKTQDTKGRGSKAKAGKGKGEKVQRTAAAKTAEAVLKSRKSKGKSGS